MPEKSNPIQVRTATKKDIVGISAVASSSFIDAFSEGTDPDILKRDVEENRSEKYFTKAIKTDAILIAKIEENIVGYIQFGDVNHDYIKSEKHDVELKRLYVLTEMHSKGIGQALMDAMFEHPRLKEAPTIFLNVWDINTKAVKFYEKQGFTNTGKKFPYFDKGVEVMHDDIYMKKLKKTK